MKTYSVSIPITGVIYTEVEAEDEESAIEAALQRPYKTKDIETWETHRHVVQGNVFYGVQSRADAEEI